MNIIRGLFQDLYSLDEYYSGKTREVSIADLERRLRLLERSRRLELTDHYYIFQAKKEVDPIRKRCKNIGEFILDSSSILAMEFLEEKNGVIFVRQEKFLEWQDLICFFPPLFLVAVYKHKKYGGYTSSNIESYIKKHIVPNVLFSALPPAHIPELEYLRKEKEGLYDLHIHLNGTMESDWIWADMMTSPTECLKEVERSFESDEMVQEHFAQVDPQMTPTKLFVLLEEAQKNRTQFIRHFMQDDLNGLSNELRKTVSEKEPSLALEMLMYIKVFSHISQTSPKPLSSTSRGKFHYYLLVRGLINMLLVHQPSQFGFRQFQKITKNSLRWYSESSFRRRFSQLSGNSLNNISLIEGRFSPKSNVTDNCKLLSNIEQGWDFFLTQTKQNGEGSRTKPQLYLVAHFIKKQRKHNYDVLLYENLRNELWGIAYALCSVKEDNCQSAKRIVGIDAASSEFDTPPEVFAPIYHYLRKRGFKHFTYHAGEDFIHIVSGLRAIFEAILFLGLERGDRIGHCVASGSDANFWLRNIDRNIYIKQGEYLSDCIFAFYLITQDSEPIKELHYLIPRLLLRINEISEVIYKESHTIANLVKAWTWRKYCPKIIQKLNNQDCLKIPISQDEEEILTIKQEWDTLPQKVRDIIVHYNSQKDSEEYDKIISIDPTEIFDAEVITMLQKRVLRYMHQKEIIIETLPTSNLRIGFYQDFSTSHIWNWLKWKSEGSPIPPIVIGTDDAGIFATNIYNEYACLYCYLVQRKGLCHKDAMALLREFNENAAIYHFRE